MRIALSEVPIPPPAEKLRNISINVHAQKPKVSQSRYGLEVENLETERGESAAYNVFLQLLEGLKAPGQFESAQSQSANKYRNHIFK